MNALDILLISIGMAMDSFAVSVCKGLSIRKAGIPEGVKCGIYFGGFQALMPVIGYYLGRLFADLIVKIDHWIAFILLLFIGLQMIRESRETENVDDRMDVKTMLILAVATSIDALTIGITLAFINVNIWIVVTSIGVVTFMFSLVGVLIGRRVGSMLGNKAKIIGGLILIYLGTKILLEHLGVI
ncbi:MAG: manganese efflux pump [Erysipelotrichaceae bacterium]|nr:manganese efflux pump [Erysipelotrichaceae bacterium]MBR2534036.1 manganese efflux pump [Erysipelotrichaceae bacterium]